MVAGQYYNTVCVCVCVYYGLDDRGSGIFLFTTVSRTALGPSQPPIQWVPGAVSLGVKRPGRESDHLPPSPCRGQECVELYLHSTNKSSWRGAWSSTGTTWPLPYTHTHTHTHTQNINVSEDKAANIFRVQSLRPEYERWSGFTLQMEIWRFFETLVSYHNTACGHNTEYLDLKILIHNVAMKLPKWLYCSN
jgi:hypothetical protein